MRVLEKDTDNRILHMDIEVGDEFNQALRELILSQFCTISNSVKDPTAITGWPNTNLLDGVFPECLRLRAIFSECLDKYLDAFSGRYRIRPRFATCWPNILRSYCGAVRPHTHHWNSFNISGAYYVAGKFQDGIGKIRFPSLVGKKDKSKAETAGVSAEITPFPGFLLMFPSNMPHQMLPYPSDIPRISIGFDLHLKKDTGLPYVDLNDSS
jgi:uncharacterized protein (TIGR02466 family)